jgi:hypothetical protein
MLSTPVVFILFNRPDLTAQTFERIRRARPTHLYIVADGPREHVEGEVDRCVAARAVVEGIDWDCQVIHDFSPVNLGCKRRVASGLSAAFERFDRAIVIEDDVLVDPSCFDFMHRMLDRFEDDGRVMMITGFNPLGRHRSDERDYHFSYCGSIWGWASWARCWKHYDIDMKRWWLPGVKEKLTATFGSEEVAAPRLAAYDRTAAGLVDTWDFQWSFARILAGGLSVVPATNLVQNLGFRSDATHTRSNSPMASVPVGSMGREPRMHDRVEADREYDLAFTRLVAAPRRP